MLYSFIVRSYDIPFESYSMKKPTLNSTLLVSLLNGVKANDLERDNYVVYMHKCINGIYIGQSEDMVRRWKQHNEAAFNVEHRDYNQKFKGYIRNFGFQHYVIATAKTETKALKIEADAIKFYKANLNSKSEASTGEHTLMFNHLELQLSATQTVIKQKGTLQTAEPKQDCDRKMVKAKIVEEKGRKRVVSVSGPFDKGLYIECAKSEREKFQAGDLVKIKVTLSSKKRGDKYYLVAERTSPLVKA